MTAPDTHLLAQPTRISPSVGTGTAAFIPAGPVSSVADTGHGLVVVGAYDSSVSLVNATTGTRHLLGHHEHLVTSVAASPGGAVVAAASAAYDISVWDLSGPQPTLRWLRGHDDDVEALTFVDDHTLASGSRDRTIRVWGLRDGVSRVLRGHGKAVLSVTGKGQQLMSSGDDMTLRIWDLSQDACKQVIGPFDVETDTCAIDPGRDRVVLGADDGCIRVFSSLDGTPLLTRHAHGSAIKKVAVSADGRILSAAYDQALRLWTPDLDPIASLRRPHGVWERTLTWARDGAHVLGGDFDGNLIEWRA